MFCGGGGNEATAAAMAAIECKIQLLASIYKLVFVGNVVSVINFIWQIWHVPQAAISICNSPPQKLNPRLTLWRNWRNDGLGSLPPRLPINFLQQRTDDSLLQRLLQK